MIYSSRLDWFATKIIFPAGRECLLWVAANQFEVLLLDERPANLANLLK